MAEWPNIRSVLFDFGGTLGYDEPGFAEGFAALVTALGYPADTMAYRAASEAARQDTPPAPREVEPWLEWRREHHRAIIRRLGVAESDVERIADAVAERHRYYSRPYRYPETNYTLKCLVKAGYIVGVISNIAPALPLVLDELEITPHLRFAVASETFGASKPDPSIFHEGLRLAGTAPEETIYVGDSVEADVVGSAGVGIHPVLIDRGNGFAGRESELRERWGAVRVTNLTQLLDLLGTNFWSDASLHEKVWSR